MFDPKTLADFKKIDADKHYTTFQHPDGHVIRVAHKSVDKDTRQELRFLKLHRGGPVPGYAEGGKVKKEAKLFDDSVGGQMDRVAFEQSFMPSPEAAPAPEAVPDSMLAGLPLEQPAAGPQLASLGPTNYQLPTQEAAPAAPSDPYGIGTQEAYSTAGLAQQQAGIQGQAKAQGQLGREQAGIQGATVDQFTKLQNDYNTQLTTLNTEREALMADVKAKHIDPDHFWKERGTVGRVTAAIGVLISGLGGATENGALSFINKEIDRDIKAQETNLGKSQSLLEANMKQYGNLKDAQTATRAMLLDMTAAKIGQAAAKSQGPMAQAQAAQAIGKLNQESAGLMGQIAARKALMTGQSQGQKAPPENIIKILVPEGQQGDYYKELGEMQQAEKTAHNLISSFEEVAKLNTVKNNIMSPIQTSRQVDAIVDPLLAELSKATAGRFTETDAHFLKSVMKPRAGSSDATIALQRQKLQKLIEEKMNFPKLKSIGIAPTPIKAGARPINAPKSFGK